MTDTNTNSVSYVRTEMLPEQAPPATQVGVIKWVRENLLSSVLNIFLTVVSLFVIYFVLSGLLPWAFGGVWNAGSLTECREVLFAVYKGSHDAACWAVIEDRWLQILFGFYPPELYWRPILAFVLLFVALAPVLFADKVPGQMMWFSMAYPFLATWLIWGGSFWTPILVALGFVVAYAVHKIVGKLSGPIVTNLAALAAAIIWWSVLLAPINDTLHKSIGSGRFDETVASLTARNDVLPDEIAVFEAQIEEQDAIIAGVLAEKDETLAQMEEIRAEEFLIEAQIEPKEVALVRLEGAKESLENLADILSEWGGNPADAVGGLTDPRDIAEAEEAAENATGLLEDITDLIADAASDIRDDTVEPSQIASEMVQVAAGKDASILEDINTMVDKDAFLGPLAEIAETAATLTVDTSPSDIVALQNPLEVMTAGLGANIDSLEEIHDKIIATNAAELADPQARLLEQMATVAALRDDATLLAQAEFRASSEFSDNRRLLGTLETLAEREAELPELDARVEEARNALPSDQRNMISINQLPEDAPEEEVALLAGYLDAETSALSAKASVRDTYRQLGLVGLTPIDSRQIGGFMLALIIGVAGIALSLPLGVLLALGRQSHLFVVNKVCVAFIEVIRGVPLIVWLFTASLLLSYFLPPGTTFDLMLRVIIMVTLFASAYIAEVIRGGLAALPTGQYEGADSLGLSYWQSMQLIVLPQAMKISIPGIVNTFIGLFKDTVLVVFIGLSDPIGFSNLIRADTDWNGIYWELFVFIGALFFIFCYSMGRYSLHLEKKLQREHR